MDEHVIVFVLMYGNNNLCISTLARVWHETWNYYLDSFWSSNAGNDTDAWHTRCYGWLRHFETNYVQYYFFDILHDHFDA